MSDEIVKNDANNKELAVDQQYGDEAFGEVSTSGKYLPRLQMFGGNSGQVKEGLIHMAHYGLVTGKDQLQDLGPTVDCLPISWRPKSMDISGESIITIFDHKDPEFKRIQERADVKDSGCMFGPEFLIWLPSVKKFASLYMANKTARREAPAIRERMTPKPQPTTLAVQFIKTTKYSWHGIVAKPCSTPFDYPSDETLAEVNDLFQNPPKPDVERVEPNAGGGRAR